LGEEDFKAFAGRVAPVENVGKEIDQVGVGGLVAVREEERVDAIASQEVEDGGHRRFLSKMG
jgi:hypothetical protein